MKINKYVIIALGIMLIYLLFTNHSKAIVINAMERNEALSRAWEIHNIINIKSQALLEYGRVAKGELEIMDGKFEDGRVGIRIKGDAKAVRVVKQQVEKELTRYLSLNNEVVYSRQFKYYVTDSSNEIAVWCSGYR